MRSEAECSRCVTWPFTLCRVPSLGTRAPVGSVMSFLTHALLSILEIRFLLRNLFFSSLLLRRCAGICPCWLRSVYVQWLSMWSDEFCCMFTPLKPSPQSRWDFSVAARGFLVPLCSLWSALSLYFRCHFLESTVSGIVLYIQWYLSFRM